MDLNEDALLFQSLQHGDKTAFERLYHQYSSLVYTFALRCCGNPDLASEITQDVFLRLWRTKAVYQPELSRFSTWLLTMTRHICYDKLRSPSQQVQKKSVSLEWDTNREMLRNGSTHELEKSWFRKDMEDALSELRPEERTIIQLAYFQGYTLNEISQQLHLPIGTVKTRLHKTLQRLRSYMRGWEGGIDDERANV